MKLSEFMEHPVNEIIKNMDVGEIHIGTDILNNVVRVTIVYKVKSEIPIVPQAEKPKDI